jgi:large-conductance mechanosensitive channel
MTSSPPTTLDITTTPIPQFYELGFIVGMSIMGGLILMVALFMFITACQRAYKKRAKKTPKPPSTKKNESAVSVMRDITIDIPVEPVETDGGGVGGDGGPF